MKGPCQFSPLCFQNGSYNLLKPLSADYAGKERLSTKHVSTRRRCQVIFPQSDFLQIPVDSLPAQI